MKQDDGQWTLQSVSTQKSYLGFKNTPKDGTPLFGINTPQSWDIEILEESEDHENPRVRYVTIAYHIGNGYFLRVYDRFWVRDTLLVVEDPKKEGRNRAWPLELLAPRGRKTQVWILQECESRLVKLLGLATGVVNFAI